MNFLIILILALILIAERIDKCKKGKKSYVSLSSKEHGTTKPQK